MDMGKIDKVIVWGCSISYGLNADKDKIYGQRVADWLGVPLINLSISGAGNIVGSNVILNKPIEFFKNSLVLFQTTYFERQIDKDLIPNPFYGNRFYKEVNSNSFRVDEFREEFGIKEEGLRIDDWVGYWTEYENFYNRKYWKYKEDLRPASWIRQAKAAARRRPAISEEGTKTKEFIGISTYDTNEYKPSQEEAPQDAPCATYNSRNRISAYVPNRRGS